MVPLSASLYIEGGRQMVLDERQPWIVLGRADLPNDPKTVSRQQLELKLVEGVVVVTRVGRSDTRLASDIDSELREGQPTPVAADETIHLDYKHGVGVVTIRMPSAPSGEVKCKREVEELPAAAPLPLASAPPAATFRVKVDAQAQAKPPPASKPPPGPAAATPVPDAPPGVKRPAEGLHAAAAEVEVKRPRENPLPMPPTASSSAAAPSSSAADDDAKDAAHDANASSHPTAADRFRALVLTYKPPVLTAPRQVTVLLRLAVGVDGRAASLTASACDGLETRSTAAAVASPWHRRLPPADGVEAELCPHPVYDDAWQLKFAPRGQGGDGSAPAPVGAAPSSSFHLDLVKSADATTARARPPAAAFAAQPSLGGAGGQVLSELLSEVAEMRARSSEQAACIGTLRACTAAREDVLCRQVETLRAAESEELTSMLPLLLTKQKRLAALELDVHGKDLLVPDDDDDDDDE